MNVGTPNSPSSARRWRGSQPRGTVLHEMLITITIAVVVLAGVAHLMVFTGQQRRGMSHRILAAREAGNLMEDFMTRPWAEITSEQLSATPLSAPCLRHLPNATLTVRVDEQDGASEGAKQISLQINWEDSANRQVTPVRLVAWRYPGREDQP